MHATQCNAMYTRKESACIEILLNTTYEHTQLTKATHKEMQELKPFTQPTQYLANHIIQQSTQRK